MKFLIVSNEGQANGIAWKLNKEGNEVVQFTKNPLANTSTVTQVGSIKEGLREQPDVVLFDSPGNGKEADSLKSEGWNVLGGGEWSDKLSSDKKFAMKAMESFGIKAPASYAFNSMQNTLEFVAQYDKNLSFKLGSMPTVYGKNQEELLAHLIHLRKNLKLEGKTFVQEVIDGTEISAEVWYSKGEVVPLPSSSFDLYKFLPGDLGTHTDGQSSVVFPYPKREPKIIQQSLKKIDAFMERIKYSGPISIKGIAKGGKFYGLEFTPGIRYPTVYAWMRLLNEPLGDILFRVATGDNSPMKLKEGFGYTSKCSVSPYPFFHENQLVMREVYGKVGDQRIFFDKQDLDTRIFPLDMYNDSKGNMYTGNLRGAVCEITGYGMDLWEAEREVSLAFKRVGLVSKQARLDGSRSAMHKIDDLRRQGYEVPPFIKPEMLTIKENKNETIAINLVNDSSASASSVEGHG